LVDDKKFTVKFCNYPEKHKTETKQLNKSKATEPNKEHDPEI
jgi:hypothetical protein